MSVRSQKHSLTLESLVESMVLGPLTAVLSEEDNNPLVLIAMINKGISGECLRNLQERIPDNLLSGLLGCSEDKLSRLFSKCLRKLQADSIYDISLLWNELREWISLPIPALSGECPEYVMATEF